jgi:hypothetical protein
MKRKRKYKTKPKSNPFYDILNKLKERIISILAIAIVSWLMGILTNYVHTFGTIKELKIENKDLSWAVDYFRK